MRATVSAILFLLSSNIIFAQTVTDGSEGSITSGEMEGLMKVLPEFLKDPTSVQISKLHKDKDNGDYVCGMINAKNSFGGYTGTQPFRFGVKNEMLITGMNSPC